MRECKGGKDDEKLKMQTIEEKYIKTDEGELYLNQRKINEWKKEMKAPLHS